MSLSEGLCPLFGNVRDAHNQYSAQRKEMFATSSEAAIFVPHWQLLLPAMINVWQEIRQTLFPGYRDEHSYDDLRCYLPYSESR